MVMADPAMIACPVEGYGRGSYNPDGPFVQHHLTPPNRCITDRNLSTMHAMGRKCSMNNLPETTEGFISHAAMRFLPCRSSITAGETLARRPPPTHLYNRPNFLTASSIDFSFSMYPYIECSLKSRS